ncbi:hypothetical protein [Nocardioides sp. URHA0020]|uniref:hypothetical protein n=1 Tax=Nocardioides sp. URHA0020 TaxID=1380392 RepID=UPI00048E157F|nr:hypothetical protein [Nocardioides sp. URHA0020]
MDLSGVTRPVVVPVPVDRAGRRGPTPDAARGKRWRASSRGLYVPADVDSSGVDQRVVEAAAVLPADWGGVTGWAGLAWMGARWFDGAPWGGGRTRPVTLAIGGNRAIRPQRAMATSEERLAPRDLVHADGVRLTTAVRSVCFEMRYALTLWDAVTDLCLACFNDLVSIAEVAAFAHAIPGWTGIGQCRDALPLASENLWSPREVGMLRAWTVDAGLPRPLCNEPVFDLGGRLLGVPDLIDPVAGVMGEYDGGVHFVDGRRRPRDLDREDSFRSHGMEYVAMIADDVRDTSRLVARLHASYARASRLPASERRWTLERPPWWIDVGSVAARRSLTTRQRDRLLGHRAA